MDFLLALLVNVLFAAVGFVVLFYVVKAAVVAGLAEDRRQRVSTGAPRTHLDEDGL